MESGLTSNNGENWPIQSRGFKLETVGNHIEKSQVLKGGLYQTEVPGA